MSLRIIIKPDQIHRWLAERDGRPARNRGNETDLRILFADESSSYEPIEFDVMLDTMKFRHLALLVDQAPGKTFHQFVERG